eukprot:6209706-Pleurochrysis_carterae.AAC.3
MARPGKPCERACPQGARPLRVVSLLTGVILPTPHGGRQESLLEIDPWEHWTTLRQHGNAKRRPAGQPRDTIYSLNMGRPDIGSLENSPWKNYIPTAHDIVARTVATACT